MHYRAITTPAVVVTLLAYFMTVTPPLHAQTPPNRWQSIDGEPRLIIGMYEKIDDDALLAALAGSGFNLVNTRDDPEDLNRLHRHGLRAWVNLGGDLALPAPGGDDGRRDKLAARVNRVKDHPAMLVWEAPDEPLWNVWYRRMNQYWRIRDAAIERVEKIEGDRRTELQSLLDRVDNLHDRGYPDEADQVLASLWQALGEDAPEETETWAETRQRAWDYGDELSRGFQLVRELDPDGIRWVNHAPRNGHDALRHYNRAVDMAGCDIYPVPFHPPSGHSDLVDQHLSSVGVYTRRMAAAAPGKSVAMILQGFCWLDIEGDHEGGDIRPTFRQTRFMAYDALMNGAAAVIWWGTAYIPKESDLWRDILATARELRALEPAWIATPIRGALRSRAEEIPGSHDGDGPTLRLSRVGEDYVLIASNATRHGFAFQVEGLPGILDGDITFAIGYSEPNAGTDLASLQTRAVRDGDEWVINGQKIWTSEAHISTHLWLAARTDPTAAKHRGISMFIVSMDTPGMTVRPLYTMSGVRTNEVFFEDVRIPADALIGEQDKGWYTVANALDFERVSLAPTGQLARQYDRTVDYLKKERPKQIKDRGTRQRLADLKIDLHVLRALNIVNASIIANHETPTMEASMTKIWSSELRYRLSSMNMDLLGRYGALRSDDEGLTPLGGQNEQTYRGSPILRFGGGTNEVQRNIIAHRGLGLPR